MSTIVGFLGLVYAAAMVWLGYIHAPIWTPLVAAIVGAILYFGVKPAAVTVLQRSGIVSSFLPIDVRHAGDYSRGSLRHRLRSRSALRLK